MAGIKSTVEMLYDSRDNKTGMIEIDIQGWQYNSFGQVYNTRVIDYVVTVEIMTIPGPPGEPPTQQEQKVRTVISQRDVQYQKDNVDLLFTQLGDPIEPSESLSQQMDAFVSAAFLEVTQTDPLYRHPDGSPSVPSDWIVQPITTTTTTTSTTIAPSTTTTTTTVNGTTTTTTTV